MEIRGQIQLKAGAPVSRSSDAWHQVSRTSGWSQQRSACERERDRSPPTCHPQSHNERPVVLVAVWSRANMHAPDRPQDSPPPKAALITGALLHHLARTARSRPGPQTNTEMATDASGNGHACSITSRAQSASIRGQRRCCRTGRCIPEDAGQRGRSDAARRIKVVGRHAQELRSRTERLQ